VKSMSSMGVAVLGVDHLKPESDVVCSFILAGLLLVPRHSKSTALLDEGVSIPAIVPAARVMTAPRRPMSA